MVDWSTISRGRVDSLAIPAALMEVAVPDAIRPVLVRMPVELHDAVKNAAGAQDRTMAQFIRQSLRESVAKETKRSARS